MSYQDNGAWALCRLTSADETLLVRMRTNLGTLVGDPALPDLLAVAWQGSIDSEAMAAFENRLVEALEGNRLALLVAVITTLDQGTRRWLWYYGDREAVEARLNEALSGDTIFPVRLTTESDPEWESYRSLLRDTTLEP